MQKAPLALFSVESLNFYCTFKETFCLHCNVLLDLRDPLAAQKHDFLSCQHREGGERRWKTSN